MGKILEPKDALKVGTLCVLAFNGNPVNHDSEPGDNTIQWIVQCVTPSLVGFQTTVPTLMTCVVKWEDIEHVYADCVMAQTLYVNMDY